MPNRQKVLYVITKSNWGGAQKYVFDLATNLSKDEFETMVAAGGNGVLFNKFKDAHIRTITIPGLERNINFSKEIKSFFELLKIFKNEKPDVVHLNSTKAGGLGAVAARLAALASRRKIKVIFTVHGWGFNEERPGWQKIIIKFLSWFSSLFQDKIILIDTADFNSAKKFIPKHKLALIFNGLEPIDFLPRPAARSFFSKNVKQTITEDTILIGTTAELTKNKGLNYLIDAVNQTKLRTVNDKLRTIIIGEGEDKKELQNQVNSLGLQNTIFLAGFIAGAQKYLKGLDIFVLPSLKEGLPYVIMEAMAAGLPVISTAVGGIPDLIKNQETGLLVPPKNSKFLAESLFALIQDADKRERFGKKAEEKVSKNFTLERMVRETTVLYSSN